ncbi:hypothetical protein [Pseudosulfitobacter koreensis]|uniref:Uncharacterized protein n=1 Tax=Pseudosulfitobacter koreensis TaxID=2968472 RepID=A0ABT1Z3K9_9RHOB|nr:hypothetical protein [Pseudosulfitobacter koreense]MCR8827729.1 hypothetical protein [Pseudosulfitobacter koreense]
MTPARQIYARGGVIGGKLRENRDTGARDLHPRMSSLQEALVTHPPDPLGPVRDCTSEART